MVTTYPQPPLQPQQSHIRIRIVCISDTHNTAPHLPKGDLLIHAGDLTNTGSYQKLKHQVEWLERAGEFQARIVVAGNHDGTLDGGERISKGGKGEGGKIEEEEKEGGGEEHEMCRALLRRTGRVVYLEHEAVTITLEASTISSASATPAQSSIAEHTDDPPTTSKPSKVKLKIFGSPYSPYYNAHSQHSAFTYPPSTPEAEALWSKMPTDMDILITHTPPQGHCDTSTSPPSPNGATSPMKGTQHRNPSEQRTGCEALRRRLSAVRPRLHVCGHFHEGRGAELITWKVKPDIGEEKVESEMEDVRYWIDPAPNMGSKKLSLLSLVPGKGEGQWSSGSQRFDRGSSTASGSGGDGARLHPVSRSERGSRTCVVNAAIMKSSYGRGLRELNKPIVVDIDFPVWNDS